MKRALISPAESVQYITSWIDFNTPVVSDLPNSARVAEVAAQAFEVCPTLFWVECSDEVTAEDWYFDTNMQVVTKIPAPPTKPIPSDQPAANGVQTL